MDTTLITPLDGIKPRPFANPEKVTRITNRVSLGIFLYIVIVIYPAYGLLRGFWVPDFPVMDLEGTLTALIVGGLFALFARRSILNRVIRQVEVGQS